MPGCALEIEMTKISTDHAHTLLKLRKQELDKNGIAVTVGRNKEHGNLGDEVAGIYTHVILSAGQ
jgi:hypothetical protein